MSNILIVDDDKQNILMLQELLKDYNHSVVSAMNGEEALEKARQEPPDIIVSDILMPVMDGFTLCSEWKSDEFLKHIPFIICSAEYTDEKDKDLAVKLGADSFIDKPINPDQLIETVKELTEDLKSGRHSAGRSILENEGKKDGVFLLYNERLIKKLEQKMLELEREVAERKRTENALLKEKNRLEEVTNFANCGLFMLDDQARIIYANSIAEKWFGALKDIKGQYCWDVLKIGGQKKKCVGLKVLESGETYRSENFVWTSDKEKRFFIEIASPVIDNNGKIYQVNLVVIDITERKKLESQLMQAQKMESLGTLAGGIAHDFNNILAIIQGFAYLARTKIPAGNEAINKLDQITEYTNRAVELVQQILTFSRPGIEEFKSVLAAPVIKESLKLLRATIPTTIELRESIFSTAYVMADITRIQQIIMNLCTNAYHAMQESGGVLNVELIEVIVDEEFASMYAEMNSGPYVRLTVSDTGQGIAPEVIERIFEPYFTTKEKGSGTGLGLSVVHGIVKSCGGTIVVFSELKKGTSFQIFLPVVQGESGEERKSDKALARGTGKILIVDDEKSMVQIGTEMMESLGYEVTGLTDSLEALEIIRLNPDKFNLVITDMTMPKITGMRLAKEIFNMRPDMPVILTTGYSEGIDEEAVKLAGIKALLKKPFSPEVLAATVQRIKQENHGE